LFLVSKDVDTGAHQALRLAWFSIDQAGNTSAQERVIINRQHSDCSRYRHSPSPLRLAPRQAFTGDALLRDLVPKFSHIAVLYRLSFF
jgi:hypothetical protein